MLTDVTVVKVGGHELDDPVWLPELCVALAAGGPTVVVHGGGREVSALQDRLGLTPEWRDGLRVTDPATLEVVSMVLTGLVNKRLVAALISAGARAAGVSGEDDGLIRAEPVRGGELGRTGAPVSVRPHLLRLLLGAGITPVVSPLSRGSDGSPLNVNADDAAVALAVALGARRLLFVSNVAGVELEGTIAAELSPVTVEEAISAGAVTGGMTPKLRAAARASAAVPQVRVGGLALLTGGQGTRVVAVRERVA